MSEKKREEILAEIKEKGIYEKDVERSVLTIQNYLNGENVKSDNSELLPWVIYELIGEFIAGYNKYAFDGEELRVRPEGMPSILGFAEFEGATLKEKKAVTEDELEAAVKVVEDYFSRRVSAEGEKLSEGKQSIVQRLFKSVLGSSLANIEGE